MTIETLIEEGIVLESCKGIAVIELKSNENCHTCGAKPFCKPEDSEKNKIKVSDPFGVFPGDIVKISVEGKTILKASFSLYGFPLIILIFSITTGLIIFKNYIYAELYSFLFGIMSVSIYYLFLFRFSLKKNANSIPKIIFVKRKEKN